MFFLSDPYAFYFLFFTYCSGWNIQHSVGCEFSRSGYPWLFPVLRDKIFSCLLLSSCITDISCRYFVDSIYQFELSSPVVLLYWFFKNYNEWILQMVFLHQLTWYSLASWYDSKCHCLPSISRINSTCSWHIILFIYCWILCISILLRNFFVYP